VPRHAAAAAEFRGLGTLGNSQPSGRAEKHLMARDAANNGGIAGFRGVYKAKVLKSCVATGSIVISEALVQHAYMHRQLRLQPSEASQARCNCKQQSFHELQVLFA